MIEVKKNSVRIHTENDDRAWVEDGVSVTLPIFHVSLPQNLKNPDVVTLAISDATLEELWRVLNRYYRHQKPIKT